MYKINSIFLFCACSLLPKETLKQKKRVAEGYSDGATGHFLRPGRGRHSHFFVRHANFKNVFLAVNINIKEK